jgi:Predicted membrane protein (DUF2254)
VERRSLAVPAAPDCADLALLGRAADRRPIRHPALVQQARGADAAIVMECAVGDALTEDTVLLRVYGGRPLPEAGLRLAIAVARNAPLSRIPSTPGGCWWTSPSRQSPAINDPTTAVQAIDQIEDLLRRLGRSALDAGCVSDAQGVLRLVFPTPTWEDYLALAFDDIRQYSASSVQVMRRLRSAVLGLAESVTETERKESVQRYLQHLNLAVEHSVLDAEDGLMALHEDRQAWVCRAARLSLRAASLASAEGPGLDVLPTRHYAAGSDLDRRSLAGAARRRHSQHPVFDPVDHRLCVAPAFRPGRSAGGRGVAAYPCQHVAVALNLVPVRGYRLLVVYRRASGPPGGAGGPLLCHRLLGSGLLFLAMLFFSAAVAGGIIIAFVAAPERLLGSATFTFARAITYEIMNVYAIKMAGVFMIATSTLALRTGFIARWIAFVGYAVALLLLLSSRYIEGILMVFPLWVLLVSLHILVGNLRGPPQRPSPVLERKPGLMPKQGRYFNALP